MTHLNIQQGLNVEVVSANLIKKLYEAALSVPEPLEGELDAAYLSGNLLVDKSYRALVEYLTNRFDDLYINVTDSYYIPFEDSAVLNVLLANNIGSDGIGVTEAEAANATFTIGLFENKTDITSFNTFNLFTRANTNPPVALFKECTNLASVNLSNITTIGEQLFNGCNKLNVSLDLPGLTLLEHAAFRNSGINSITNLGSITSIPNECFRGCTRLTSVTLPSSVTSIGLLSFADCHMTTIDLSHVISIGEEAFVNSYLTTTDLSNVTSIGRSAFRGSRLTGVLDLQNLTSLGGYAFLSTNITQISLPNTLRTFDVTAFNSCAIEKIIIPEGCTTLTGGLPTTKNNAIKYFEISSTVTNMSIFFHRMYENTSNNNSIYIVIKATTPPNLGFYGLETVNSNSYVTVKIAGIYVPDSALSTYQDVANLSDDQKGWKVASVQGKLKPISLLETDSPTWWAEYLTRANS